MAKMEKQSARCRVDDIAATFVIPRRFRFFVWVTLNERKWVTLAERRGLVIHVVFKPPVEFLD